jgi:hypothetical protein
MERGAMTVTGIGFRETADGMATAAIAKGDGE